MAKRPVPRPQQRARWAGPDHRTIHLTREDGTLAYVPADPENMDYARIMHGDPDTETPPLEVEEAE